MQTMPEQVRIRPVHIAVLAIVIAYAGVVRLNLMDRPFARDFEGCGSFFGLLARNYQLFPPRNTLYLPVQSTSDAALQPTTYFNHPPLVPILIHRTHSLFGYDARAAEPAPPWHLRLPASIFTGGCIVLVFLLLRGMPFRAICASAIFAVTPMTVLYGGMPDVIGSQLIFFVLLSVLTYLRMAERPTVPRAAAFAIAFALAAATDWPAFYLVPALLLHAGMLRERKLFILAIGISVYALAVFGLLYAQAAVVAQDWGWMLRAFSRRALSTESDANTAITLVGWVQTAFLGHAMSRITLPILLATVAWIIAALWRPARTMHRDPATAILAIFAVVHVAIGRQGVYQHDWWWWPVVPAGAMAASACLQFIADRARVSGIGTVTAVAILAGGTWTTVAGFRELANPKTIVNSDLDYSVVELGETIRQSTPPAQRALLVESDDSVALWYYACRDIHRNIWTPEQFEKALLSQNVDLLFGAAAPSRSTPSVAIVPKAYAPHSAELLSYLRARYRQYEVAKFMIFDLRTPAAN